MRVSRSGAWMSVRRPHSNRPQPFLERRDLARWSIGRDDDLSAAFVQRVEGVEELLLDPLLALDELDVVDEQHVVVAVAALEPLDPRPALAHGVDELVHERLARHVARGETARVLADVMADRLEEVCLAESGAPVDEERFVGLRRRLGDRERRCVGEPVRRPDHEEVEGVLRIELDLDLDLRRPLAHEFGGRFDGRDVVDPLGCGWALGRSLGHLEADGCALRSRVGCRAHDDVEKMTFDPVAREVVRDLDDDTLSADRMRPRLSEPGVVRGVGEGVPQPASDGVPEVVGSCLGGVLHPSSRYSGVVRKGRA